MRDRGIVPELEIFDLGMLNFAHVLHKRGCCRARSSRTCSSATSPACRPRSRGRLAVERLPAGAMWSGAGLGDYQLTAQSLAWRRAAASGSASRTASTSTGPDPLATNPMLVERVHELLEVHDRHAMTPAELRARLADDRARGSADPARARRGGGRSRAPSSASSRDGPWVLRRAGGPFERDFAAYPGPPPQVVGVGNGTTPWSWRSRPSGSRRRRGAGRRDEGGYAATAAAQLGLRVRVMDVDPSTWARRRHGAAAADHPAWRRSSSRTCTATWSPLTELDAWRRVRGLAARRGLRPGARPAPRRSSTSARWATRRRTASTRPRTSGRSVTAARRAPDERRRARPARCGSTAGASAIRVDAPAAATAGSTRCRPRSWPRGCRSSTRATPAAGRSRDATAQRPPAGRLHGDPVTTVAHHARAFAADRGRDPSGPPVRRGDRDRRALPLAGRARCPGSSSRAGPPVAAARRDRILSLPCFPEMTDAEVDRVVRGAPGGGRDGLMNGSRVSVSRRPRPLVPVELAEWIRVQRGLRGRGAARGAARGGHASVPRAGGPGVRSVAV